MSDGPSWKGMPLCWGPKHAIERRQSEGIPPNRVYQIVRYGWEDFGGGPGENLVTDGELTVVLMRGRQGGQPVWVIKTILKYLSEEDRKAAARGERFYKRRPAAISHW